MLDRLGFPEGTVFRHLTVSIPGACVIVVASRAGDPLRSDRIYVRELSASAYREIPWPSGCNSFGTPITSHCAPELYVLGERWRDLGSDLIGQRWRDLGAVDPSPQKQKQRSRGADTAGLYRVRLPSGDAELVHSGQRLQAGTETARSGDGDWFLSQLHGFTADGERLIVTLGMGRSDRETITWSYSLATFDPHAGTFDVLAELPAIFA